MVKEIENEDASLIDNEDGTYTIKATVTKKQLEQLLDMMPKPSEPSEESEIQPMGWFSGSWHCVKVTSGASVVHKESIYENDIWKYARAFIMNKRVGTVTGAGFTLSHGKCS